ncbi:MAG: response regulator, partial [Gammaproteobacteria bacterium]|nr:response regulator [Gammaproteobacteria bacterium]
TILGDGSVVPVLDIPELLRTSTQSEEKTDDDYFEQAEVITALPTALVVDDSLSARRALAQVVRDAGYDVRTAKDGLEAIEIIDKKIPDILLVDMEMPRMNGMELTSHVRANPDTSNIPVIMVTSRSTKKHREQAKSSGVNVHLSKPFSEDDLLDHISKLLN